MSKRPFEILADNRLSRANRDFHHFLLNRSWRSFWQFWQDRFIASKIETGEMKTPHDPVDTVSTSLLTPVPSAIFDAMKHQPVATDTKPRNLDTDKIGILSVSATPPSVEHRSTYTLDPHAILQSVLQSIADYQHQFSAYPEQVLVNPKIKQVLAIQGRNLDIYQEDSTLPDFSLVLIGH